MAVNTTHYKLIPFVLKREWDNIPIVLSKRDFPSYINPRITDMSILDGSDKCHVSSHDKYGSFLTIIVTNIAKDSSEALMRITFINKPKK